MRIRIDKVATGLPHGLSKGEAGIVFKDVLPILKQPLSEVRFSNSLDVSHERDGWQENLFLGGKRLTVKSRGLSREDTLRGIVCFLMFCAASPKRHIDQRLLYFQATRLSRRKIEEIESQALPVVSKITEDLSPVAIKG